MEYCLKSVDNFLEKKKELSNFRNRLYSHGVYSRLFVKRFSLIFQNKNWWWGKTEKSLEI